MEQNTVWALELFCWKTIGGIYFPSRNMVRISTLCGSMKRYIERGIQRGGNYLQVIGWLVQEAYLKDFWGKPIRIFIFACVRMAFQAGAVTVLYLYANALKDGKNISLVSLNFQARDSMALMWMVIVLIFGLFVLTTVFQYLSRVTALSLGSAYEEKSSRRVLRIISRLPDPRTPSANELLRGGAWKKIFGDARRAGMTIRRVGYAVPQFISGAGAAAAVIFIDYQLTLIIVSLMMLVFAAQYPLNVKGAGHSRVFEEEIGNASRRLTELARSFLATSGGRDVNDQEIDRIYADGGYRPAIEAFKGRVKILEESTLVTEIGGAFVISVAVFVIGSRLLHDGINWGSLLAYVVSLRIALGGVAQAARLFANASRFYPQLSRYHEFSSAGKGLERISIPLHKGEKIILRKGNEVKNKVILEVPQILALYTLDPIDRGLFHLFNFARIKEPSGNIRPFMTVPCIIQEPVQISNAKSSNEGADYPRPGSVFVIKAETFEGVPQEVRRLLSNDSLLLIIYSDPAHIPIFSESLAVFWIDSQLHGVADVKSDDFASAARIFQTLASMRKRKASGEEADQDDEDDF